MAALPTIRSIAKAAGVAKSTVSYALRNSPNIPLATRRKIQDIAHRLGYQRNPLVGAFMSNLRATRPTSYQATLAWATSHPSEDGWFLTNRPALLMHQAARKRCEERGFRLETIWLRQPGASPKRINRIFAARGIRGVIIAGLPVPRGHVSLDFSHLAAVTVGYSVVRPKLDRVTPHYYQNVLNILRRARAMGYRRIGFVYAKRINQRLDYYLSAALHTDQMRRRNHCGVEPLILSQEIDFVTPMGRWLEEQCPDVVIAESAFFADVIRQTGRRVPEDVGFALFNWLPGDEGVAGMYQNYERIGSSAADQIINHMYMNEYGLSPDPNATLIEGTWIEGTTVRSLISSSPVATVRFRKRSGARSPGAA